MESASKVAFTTLCGLEEPFDLANTSLIPALSNTARIAPPAMIPVPAAAGLINTKPPENLPSIGCGTVCLNKGTRTRFFLASSIPFAIASVTSFALPKPYPTTPLPSPTTTMAEKLNLLPPFTTLATRLIATTRSFNSISLALMLLIFNLDMFLEF